MITDMTEVVCTAQFVSVAATWLAIILVLVELAKSFRKTGLDKKAPR